MFVCEHSRPTKQRPSRSWLLALRCHVLLNKSLVLSTRIMAGIRGWRQQNRHVMDCQFLLENELDRLKFNCMKERSEQPAFYDVGIGLPGNRG